MTAVEQPAGAVPVGATVTVLTGDGPVVGTLTGYDDDGRAVVHAHDHTGDLTAPGGDVGLTPGAIQPYEGARDLLCESRWTSRGGWGRLHPGEHFCTAEATPHPTPCACPCGSSVFDADDDEVILFETDDDDGEAI